MRSTVIFASLILSALCGIAMSQTTAPSTTQTTGPEVIRMTLHPMPASQPALRYQLMPPMSEMRPGDAAYNYELASEWLSRIDLNRNDPIGDRLRSADRNSFPVAEATAYMEKASTRWIEQGARCDRAHWDTDYRNTGINALLPFLNSLRLEANLMAIDGRLAVAKGDFDHAQQSIQTNLSMAHQLNDDPFLVQGLVAAGIANLTLESDVTDWVARAGSPNLYWSLAALPVPFIDRWSIRKMEAAQMAFSDKPYFALALEGKLPTDQWPQLVRFLVHLQQVSKVAFDLNKAQELDVDHQVADVVATELPEARKYLLSTGMTNAQASAVPEMKAVGSYWINQYQTAEDDRWKVWVLPFPQAAPLLLAQQPAGRRLEELARHPLLSYFQFNVLNARFRIENVDRQIAVLRVIEALRDYAARHDGTVPDSLDQITDLPIPLDPVTGKGFEYHRENQTVTIETASPAGLSSNVGRRYELTFIRP